jgi:hypothetical protein
LGLHRGEEEVMTILWRRLESSYDTWKDLEAQYKDFKPPPFSQQAPLFLKLMKNLNEIVSLQSHGQARFATKRDRVAGGDKPLPLTEAEVLEEIENYVKLEELRMQWVKDCMTYETLKNMMRRL